MNIATLRQVLLYCTIINCGGLLDVWVIGPAAAPLAVRVGGSVLAAIP